MIDFPCKCGFRFSVPDDRAGTSFQCPGCGLLVDVPLLSDLASIDKDGTFKIEPFQVEDAQKREEELIRAYTPKRTDEEGGEEYDLRVTMEQIMAAGVDSRPLEEKDRPLPGAPRYDPETGELIEVVDVRPDDKKPPTVAPKGTPTLNYQHAEPPIPLWKVPVELFRTGSLVVMGMVLGLHILMLLVEIPVSIGFWFVYAFDVFLFFLIIAHFANVVEDIGVETADELPAPMRGAAWGEDLFRPAWRFICAMALCYLPANFVYANSPMASMGLLVLGTLALPVVFLTLTTSGTWANMRPDRLIAVVGICGTRYAVAIILWIIAAATYFGGFVMATRLSRAVARFVLHTSGSSAFAASELIIGFVGLATLVGGIFFMHLFCWYLGLIYRRHHEQFPWLLQRHIPKPKILGAPAMTPAAQPVQTPPAAPERAAPRRVEPVAPAEPAHPDDTYNLAEPLPRRQPRRVEPIRVIPLNPRQP